jgi:phosphonate transport system substrate-binding protein
LRFNVRHGIPAAEETGSIFFLPPPFRFLFVLSSPWLFAALLIIAPAAARAANEYIVAIVPQFPPAVIKNDWAPLVEQVSRSSGVKLVMKYYRSIPAFEQDFLKGVPDFVYLNPYHAVTARRAQGYIPLLRDGEHKLVGILVVRRNSGITGVQDLSGKKIAFPSPNSFAASLYMRALLTKKEGISFLPSYLTTHSNVYRHVVLGKTAAGGGVNKTLNKEAPELTALLKVVYETPGVAAHPLCVHPRVAPSVRNAVSSAILDLKDTSEGRELLNKVEMNTPVQADYERDYRVLEDLGLERFTVKGGVKP